jgi:GntR family transcriptional regulator/MocR family aminotransferase
MAVSAFMTEGQLARPVRKMRQIYGKRRDLLYTLLQDDFFDWLEPIASQYGMHVAAWARDGIDVEAIAQAAAERAVKVHTLDRYYLRQPSRRGLVFGYGAVDLPEIKQGLAALQCAFSSICHVKASTR